MRDDLFLKSGTAKRAAIKGLSVCGKTGSAEVSDDKSVETNAWFTGFIYDEAHPYAIAVVIEKAGSGGALATTVVDIVNSYFTSADALKDVHGENELIP